jgi:hypothetical protein
MPLADILKHLDFFAGGLRSQLRMHSSDHAGPAQV